MRDTSTNSSTYISSLLLSGSAVPGDTPYDAFVIGAGLDPNTSTVVEYGTDLNGWTAAVDGDNGVEILVTEDGFDGPGSGVDRVDVYVPKLPGGKMFGRLIVEVGP